MKNNCTITKTLCVFIILLICIQSAMTKIDNFNNFYDMKDFYKYRILPGVEQHRFRINEMHELSCLTEVGQGINRCAKFKKDDKTIPKPGTGKYNIANLDLVCGINMYGPGQYTYGYYHKGQPCNLAQLQIFDKWLCKDFHGMDIATYLTYDKVDMNNMEFASNKQLYCASFDNETCATFKKQKDCKAVAGQFGLYKLSMGHQGAFRRTEADTLSGKMFVLHHNVPVSRWRPAELQTDGNTNIKVGKKLIKASKRWQRRFSGVHYNYQNFLEFETPAALNYVRFKIVSSRAQAENTNYNKMQIALILDDRIIGQQDHSTAYQQMTYQTEFKGIAKDIKKGKHKLAFRVVQDYGFYFEAGEVSVDILGYY